MAICILLMYGKIDMVLSVAPPLLLLGPPEVSFNSLEKIT